MVSYCLMGTQFVLQDATCGWIVVIAQQFDVLNAAELYP